MQIDEMERFHSLPLTLPLRLPACPPLCACANASVMCARDKQLCV